MARLIRGRAARCPILEKWTRDVGKQYGLQRFEVEDLPNGDLILSILVVPADKRNQGVGTAVVKNLVALADQNSRRVWLTPSKKSTAIGTTSRPRLVAFYKQFGFIENKGKNRDYSQRQTMYRDPGGGAQAGGGNASYGADHAFSVVELPSMASEASVRRALWKSGVREVYSEITRDDDEISIVLANERGRTMGTARAMRVFFEKGDKDLCVRAFAGLKTAEPRITNMWAVRGTQLGRTMRGRGVGAILYRALLDAASEAGGALVPDSCFKGGTTSKAALATWHRMRGPAWGPFRWNPLLLPGKPRRPGGKGRSGQARGRGRSVQVTDLSWLLLPPGAPLIHKLVGDEAGMLVEDGSTKYMSFFGSMRYVWYVRGTPVAGLQVMSGDGGWSGVIANVWTDPAHRRKGYARRLLEAAREDYPNGIAHSEVTEEGEFWRDAVEKGRGAQGRANVQFYAAGRAARGRSSSLPLRWNVSGDVPGAVGKIDPVMNPAYNLREVYKQAILLEDHLVNPRKRCQDCISKHAHAIEGFIEETCGLDKKGLHTALCAQLHTDNRRVQQRLIAGDDYAAVAQDVRAMRKRLNGFVRLRPA